MARAWPGADRGAFNTLPRLSLAGPCYAAAYSESELVRRGLRYIMHGVLPKQSALKLAGSSVGKFTKGPRDLATNKKHLECFGE